MRRRCLIVPTARLCGVGLHSGRQASVVVEPTTPGSGLQIVRQDSQRRDPRPVALAHSLATDRRTTLLLGEATIQTAEHLLSALYALGIDDALIRLTGDELPAVDGSAAPFVEALLVASEEQPPAPPPLRVERAFERREDAARCALAPAGAQPLTLDCTIVFDHPAIGCQRRAITLGAADDSYAHDIAPARTFGFANEVELLRGRGLALGGSLDNAVVFDDVGVLNPAGLRFSDEPVRHKLLDAIGDLALLGGRLCATLTLERCGHALLNRTLREALAAGAITRSPAHTSLRAP